LFAWYALIFIFGTICRTPLGVSQLSSSCLFYIDFFNLAFCQFSDDIFLMVQVLKRTGWDCSDLETICIKDQTLTTESKVFLAIISICMIDIWCNSTDNILSTPFTRCGEDHWLGRKLSFYAIT